MASTPLHKLIIHQLRLWPIWTKFLGYNFTQVFHTDDHNLILLILYVRFVCARVIGQCVLLSRKLQKRFKANKWWPGTLCCKWRRGFNCASLVKQAVGQQLLCVFVNNGLRDNESEQVLDIYRTLGVEFIMWTPRTVF